MSERARLNLTTDDLDVLRRLSEAQRDLGTLADDLLLRRRGTKRAEREAIGRKLNAVKASLKSVELRLGE